jgi:hypothetical protein
MAEDPTAPRVVATFYSVEEAELARANLEGAGITAVVEGKHTVGVLPMHAIAFGGVRVVVQAKDLLSAQELLGQGKVEEQAPSEAEPSTDRGDKEMRRAAFAGFLGFSMCPGVGALYALVLLFRYGGLPLSSRGRTHKRIAVGCCLITAAFLAVWGLSVVRPLRNLCSLPDSPRALSVESVITT